jgi:2-polyprenyl-3-methyl-5-hydroxy-6-metoxy-1,4-benzoquinol methylase
LIASTEQYDAVFRARQSFGISNEAIYRMVARELEPYAARDAVFFDVGCGTGSLHPFVERLCGRYVGIDVIRYDGFPRNLEFIEADLDRDALGNLSGAADIVVSCETIEHLENPRSFMRKLAYFAKAGGIVAVTTPNQLSLLSLLTLVVKKRFSAFQDVHYPAHISALLEIDLKRMAAEAGLADCHICYSESGRIVFTGRQYPEWLSRLWSRGFSDNLMVIGTKANG